MQPANGEFNFQAFSTFLKSFWGVLASFTVLLPTIIYFTNTTQIKESVLSSYYVGAPTTFALLTIPFLFLYENKLSSIDNTRKASAVFFVLSIGVFFGFVFVKNVYMGKKQYTIEQTNEHGRQEIFEEANGIIHIATYPRVTEGSLGEGHTVRAETRTSGIKFASLALYTSCIILLTAAFAGAGIFYYTKNKTIPVA